MKRIGIITLYKDSNNIGGLLQAWALTYIIDRMGYNAKQILLGDIENNTKKKSYYMLVKNKGFKWVIMVVWNRIKVRFNRSDISQNELAKAKEKCRLYREKIPHTKEIRIEDLKELNDEFDIFISGSDQIWNPKYRNNAYYLDFVTKKKISYAASIAIYDFSKYEKQRLGDKVKDFDWVSVREVQAKRLLYNQYGISSDLVLDPTMLIDRKEWSVEEKKVNCKEKYIFCYFLSGSRKKRIFAQHFAKEKGLKLIYPLFVGENIRYDDVSKGEVVVNDVGPQEWLYLLSHSEYVLTDSFHGTVFSIIYNKQFYHVLRENVKGKQSMNSRIESLLSMFNLEDRLCDLHEVPFEKSILYNEINTVLYREREKSLALLKRELE